ncbi:MAG TPA: hypothetical protein VKT30_16970 [Caulobacteraceae bacterium]|nr:hypothetical protein [Caulobacteraceae bacterium]
MPRLVQPTRPPRKGLFDPRSTGAALPLRTPAILALRGTFKGR